MNTKRLYLYQIITKFLPPSRCNKFKARLLRWCGACVGNNVEIMSSAKFYGEVEVYIGDNVFIGHDAMIMGPAGSKITLEDYSKVGSRAILVTGYHRLEPEGPCILGEGKSASIVVRKGGVVNTASIVYPGIIIGHMSYVSAGSVVTHNVPDYTRVGGVPARVITKYKELV